MCTIGKNTWPIAVLILKHTLNNFTIGTLLPIHCYDGCSAVDCFEIQNICTKKGGIWGFFWGGLVKVKASSNSGHWVFLKWKAGGRPESALESINCVHAIKVKFVLKEIVKYKLISSHQTLGKMTNKHISQNVTLFLKGKTLSGHGYILASTGLGLWGLSAECFYQSTKSLLLTRHGIFCTECWRNRNQSHSLPMQVEGFIHSHSGGVPLPPGWIIIIHLIGIILCSPWCLNLLLMRHRKYFTSEK